MELIFKKLVAEYELGEFINSSKVEEGVLNENHIIETTSGKYFVKGIRSKVTERIDYIYKIEKTMKQSGIPAVAMLPSNTKIPYLIIENVYYTVYPFIPSDRSHEYSETDLFNIGKMLGKIHKVSEDLDINEFRIHMFKFANHERKIEKLKNYKEKIEAKNTRDRTDEMFLEYLSLKEKAFTEIGDIPEPLSKTLIHGDYHAGNLLIDKGSREILGIIDWEKAEVAPRSYELARSILYIAFNLGFIESEAFGKAVHLIRGYDSEFPISKEELVIGLKIRLRQCALSTWLEEGHYDRNDSKTNHFADNEIRHLNLFVFGDGVERLLLQCL